MVSNCATRPGQVDRMIIRRVILSCKLLRPFLRHTTQMKRLDSVDRSDSVICVLNYAVNSLDPNYPGYFYFFTNQLPNNDHLYCNKQTPYIGFPENMLEDVLIVRSSATELNLSVGCFYYRAFVLFMLSLNQHYSRSEQTSSRKYPALYGTTRIISLIFIAVETYCSLP